MTAPHQHGLTSDDIWEILIVCWIFGGGAIAAAGERLHRVRKRHLKAAEARHRRKVELAYARSGMLPPGRKAAPAQVPGCEHALPAAVIAAPPGARPVAEVPGACRHERIVPVITDDGDVLRWICANYQRCEATFPASIALYEKESDS